jgi:hypothetical protein
MQPKPQLYRVNGQLSVDPKWEHLDRRLFAPPPIIPPVHPPPPAPLPPMQKDGYRRKPLPPKDDGAIVLNFVPVKICTIKGCYQPVPAEYEKKTCLDCQERYKGYAVTKRAKRRAMKRARVEPNSSGEAAISNIDSERQRAHREDSVQEDDMSDDRDDRSGPDEDGYDPDISMDMDHDIPIDPAIHNGPSTSGSQYLPFGSNHMKERNIPEMVAPTVERYARLGVNDVLNLPEPEDRPSRTTSVSATFIDNNYLTFLIPFSSFHRSYHLS